MPDPILSREEIDALLKSSPGGESAAMPLKPAMIDAFAEQLRVATAAALGALTGHEPELAAAQSQILPSAQVALEAPTSGRVLFLMKLRGRILGVGALWVEEALWGGPQAEAAAATPPEAVLAQWLAESLRTGLARDLELELERCPAEDIVPAALAGEEELVLIRFGAERTAVEYAFPLDVASDLVQAGTAAQLAAEGGRRTTAADLAGAPLRREERSERPRREESVRRPSAPSRPEAPFGPPPQIRSASFEAFQAEPSPAQSPNLNLILDVPVEITVELGRTHMEIREILQLGKGSVFALEKMAGEPVDVYVNGKRIARGETVVMDDENFGVRITEIVNPFERVNNLQ